MLDKVISDGIFKKKKICYFSILSWSKACDLEMLLNIFIDSIQVIKYISNLSYTGRRLTFKFSFECKKENTLSYIFLTILYP